jgi:serine/threonine protein phosphatase PrpC
MSDSRSPHLVIDGEMEEAELHRWGSGEVALFSCRSPGREGPNEDSAAILPFDDASFAVVVADGMGGERAGARASALAIEALERALGEARRQGWVLRNAILDGIERANQAVAELGVGAGTTLAVVEIAGATMRPYHVGDSGILLVGQRGKLRLQTVAHSPVGFAIESGLLDEGEAMHHAERHIVSNVLGAPDMRIEVGSERRLRLRDTLLVASDGLWDNLRTEEVVALLRCGPLDAACARIAELARARMHTPGSDDPSKPDDLTFVAFRLSGPVRRGRAGDRSSRARRASPDR